MPGGGVVEGAQQMIDFVERRTQLARVRVVGAGDPVEVHEREFGVGVVGHIRLDA